MNLSDEEIKRYDRHLKLSDFGLEKQIRLKQAKVLLVGAGGLGCPMALYLAASGVGAITVVDDDIIELSNLQRQIAFSEAEIGQFKSTVLSGRISNLNSEVEITDLKERIDADNVETIIAGHDLVIDGSDNFATRFLVADACYLSKISYLQAAVHQYQGQICLFVPDKTACFRCLFRQPPQGSALPPCLEAGILGIVTGSIGLLAATEAIKYLTDLGVSIAGKVLIYNTLSQDLKKFDLKHDSDCPLCGKNPTIKKIGMNNGFQERNNASCIERLEADEHVISITEAVQLNKQKGQKEKIFLVDVREEHEYQQGSLENAIFLPLSWLEVVPIENLALELRAKLTDISSDKKQTILCYCQRGTRSLKAVNILRKAGLINVYSLAGGIEAWNVAELNIQLVSPNMP